MSTLAREILDSLAEVERLRAQRHGDLALGARVVEVKAFQARRFARSYADLLAHPRYQAAARFFLEELYGPQEFAARDAQFARVVPALVRLFPADIVATVAALATLHALSEQLDMRMAQALASSPALDPVLYVRAWQRVGEPAQRNRQIALTIGIGRDLDRYTRNRLLRGSLHLMRGPARSAGLGDLQRFLECGFDTFGAMGGAAHFLDTVQAREEALAAALFAPDAETAAGRLSARSSVDDTGGLAALAQSGRA